MRPLVRSRATEFGSSATRRGRKLFAPAGVAHRREVDPAGISRVRPEHVGDRVEELLLARIGQGRGDCGENGGGRRGQRRVAHRPHLGEARSQGLDLGEIERLRRNRRILGQPAAVAALAFDPRTPARSASMPR